MNGTEQSLVAALGERFSDRVTVSPPKQGIPTLEIDVGAWLEVCRALRDEDVFAFDQLTDAAGLGLGLRPAVTGVQGLYQQIERAR